MNQAILGFLLIGLAACGTNNRSSLFSDTEGDKCDSINVREVDVYLSGPGSQTVPLKYEHVPPQDSDLPTIIYLPGGPGGSSIGDRENRYPNGYGFIHTDPRGVGCNGSHEFPESSLSTNQLAEDVSQIIDSSGVRNYMIYGHSFGTMLATMPVHKIERSLMPQPKYMVLEGVLGRAFKNMDDAMAETVKQWQLTKAAIPARLRQDLEDNKFPLGLTGEQIGSNLGKLLSAGTMNGEYLPVVTLANSVSDDPQKRELAKTYLSAPMRTPQSKLAKVITCQEIAPSTNALMKLVDGEIMIMESGFCNGYRFDPHYDSRDYQIRSKIYYFNGDRDAATSIGLMNHHYDSQEFGQKVAVTIPGAGHVPLLLSLAECMPEIWLALTAGRDDQIETIASRCTAGVTVNGK